MLPILNIGPLAVQTPLLILLIGVWIGIALAEKGARKSGLPEEDISNMILVVLVGFLVGGRLIFVFQNLDRYLEAPLGIILPNPNTLALLEGGVLGVVAGIVHAQKKQLPLWKTLDVLIPSLAVLLAAAAGMNLASGEAYGTLSGVPWAIELRGGWRHPVQVYELVLCGSIAAGLMRWRTGQPGARFAAGAAMLAAARLFTEGFRGDPLVLGGGWRVAQLSALVLLFGSLYLLRKRIQAAETPD